MFLVCGEVLFDVFVAENRENGLTLDARPGGSPFNVALGLVRLGAPTEFFTGMSRDPLGRRLMDFMDRNAIGLRHVVHIDRPTAISLVDLNDDGAPAYAFYGDHPAYAAITSAELPQLGGEIRAVHIGSIATVLEPGATALTTLAERESATRLVSYDPNVRTTIEPDLDVWRRRLTQISRFAHLVKVSADDLEMIYPGRGPADLAEHLLTLGARLVVVTRGTAGAQAWTHTCRAEVAGQSVALVDAVGAGDSFQAALLFRLAEAGHLSQAGLDELNGDQLSRLLDFAARASAITCSRRGADLPSRGDLEPAANFLGDSSH